MEAGLEAVDYYDPPNLTFPFGSYIAVVDIDKGTGRGQDPPVRRGRRLRQHHQPDDRGRADPRRPDDGPRPGAVRGDHLRRAGQQPRRHVHGLPPADGRRDAAPGSSRRPSPPRRTTRSAPRASASRRRSARRRPSRTPSSTRCGTSASATSTSRSRRPRSGGSCTRRASPRPCPGRIPFRRASRSSTRRGPPFAMATVVAVRRPTSARPGARGIIHPDGTIEGWVGGSCAQPVVVREALRSLADGQPRLLRLSKDGPAEGRRGDGVVELRHDLPLRGNAGDLRGTASPRAGAVGRRHDAHRRRARLPGGGHGLAGHRVRPGRRGRGLPRRRAGLAGDRPPPVRPRRAALRRRRHPGHLGRGGAGRGAAPRRVAYVGLVASPTRAGVVRAWLRDEGVPRGAARRAARAGGHRPRRRDAGGGRALDPRRARPGPARPRAVRGAARARDAGRRGGEGAPDARSSPPSTTSCSSTPCAA